MYTKLSGFAASELEDDSATKLLVKTHCVRVRVSVSAKSNRDP